MPAIINWAKERKELAGFMERMPFKIPLDRPVSELAAGEKQKLEIVKQLYLGRSFLILDEPTSVLTPAEADEMLGLVRGMTERGELTVLMISHKFHEVTKFTDAVTVLRRGKMAGSGLVKDLSTKDMAAMMIGDVKLAELDTRLPVPADATPILVVSDIKAPDRTGLKMIDIGNLTVHAGEIVGIAGISGNGQKELAEVLAGQRPPDAGSITVKGSLYGATRQETRINNVRFIPEEPLQQCLRAQNDGDGKSRLPHLRREERGRRRPLARHEVDAQARGLADLGFQGEDRVSLLADRLAFRRQRPARRACP